MTNWAWTSVDAGLTYEKYRALGNIRFKQLEAVVNEKQRKLFVDARDFGAQGNRVADDSAPIKKALNSSSEGVVLYLPRPAVGYRIPTTVEVPANSSIISDQGTIIAETGATPFAVAGNNVEFEGLRFDQSDHLTNTGTDEDQAAIVSIGYDQVKIRRCHLVGGTSTTARAGRFGFYYQNGDGLVIDECTSEYFTLWGWFILGGTNYKILDSYGIGHGFDGFKVGGVDTPATSTEHHQVIISGNHAWDNAGDGLDLAMNISSGIAIRDNVFFDNEDHGIDFKAVYQDGDIKVWSIQNNHLLNNQIGQLHVQGDIDNRCIRNGQVIGNLMYEDGISSTMMQIIEAGALVSQNSVLGGLYGLRATARMTDANRLGADGVAGAESPRVIFRNNHVEDGSIGVLFESQLGGELKNVEVYDNDFHTLNGNTYRFKHIDDAATAGSVSGIIWGNRGKAGNDQYSWLDLSTSVTSIPQAGTIDVTYGEQRLGFSTGVPTGRGTPGDYYAFAQPQEGNYEKYEATNRNASATWRGVGYRVKTGSATWDPASVASGAATSTTIATFSGLSVTDVVEATFGRAIPVGCVLFGTVTNATTVTVTLVNLSGSAVDLASATLRVRIRPVTD